MKDRSGTPHNDAGFVSSFMKRLIRERVPVEGSIELTHRCNLHCVHCYLGDQSEIRHHRHEELSTVEVKGILDQLAAAGTMTLTLTGGDPMVRGDFPEIYEYAVRKGLFVIVFCDGVLIDDGIVELFRRYPPWHVEVSLYGATAPTYERITQVKGSHARCMAGIARLRKNGIRFRLKTVLMRINAHELDAMEDQARALGVNFHYDAAVFPCLPYADNGGRSNAPSGGRLNGIPVAPPVLPSSQQAPAAAGDPLDTSGAGRAVRNLLPTHAPTELRVSPEEVAAIDLATEARRAPWVAEYQEKKDFRLPDRLYLCGAGLSNFHIDPYGNLQPCVLTTHVQYNLRQGSFLEGWNGPIAAIRDVVPRDGYTCNDCEMRPVCSGCPALFHVENGAADVRSSYICRTTQARYHGIVAGEQSGKYP